MWAVGWWPVGRNSRSSIGRIRRRGIGAGPGIASAVLGTLSIYISSLALYFQYPIFTFYWGAIYLTGSCENRQAGT